MRAPRKINFYLFTSWIQKFVTFDVVVSNEIIPDTAKCVSKIDMDLSLRLTKLIFPKEKCTIKMFSDVFTVEWKT